VIVIPTDLSNDPRQLRERARSRADWLGSAGRPLQFQQEHLYNPHASRAEQDGFDASIDRFQHAELHLTVAFRGNALNVAEEEVPELFNLGQAPPPQGTDDPPDQEVELLLPR
jgi:hypothetical protein